MTGVNKKHEGVAKKTAFEGFKTGNLLVRVMKCKLSLTITGQMTGTPVEKNCTFLGLGHSRGQLA